MANVETCELCGETYSLDEFFAVSPRGIKYKKSPIRITSDQTIKRSSIEFDEKPMSWKCCPKCTMKFEKFVNERLKKKDKNSPVFKEEDYE